MNHQELRFRGIKLKDLGAMQSYLTEHAKKILMWTGRSRT